MLARILYEEKKDTQRAIQLLIESTSACKDPHCKMEYLSECLRALRRETKETILSVRGLVIQKLSTFHSEQILEEWRYAGWMFAILQRFLDDGNYEDYDLIVPIFETYPIQEMDLEERYQAMKEYASVLKKGRLTPKMCQYLANDRAKQEEVTAQELVEQQEEENVREAVQLLKSEAPAFCKQSAQYQELVRLLGVGEKPPAPKKEKTNLKVKPKPTKLSEYTFIEDAEQPTGIYQLKWKKFVEKWKKPLLISGITLAVVLILVAVSYPHMQRWMQSSYENSHNNLLDKEELDKKQRLERTYRNRTDVLISYRQYEGDGTGVLSFEGASYMYYIVHVSDDEPKGQLYCNILSDKDKEQLEKELETIFNSQATDYEKCRKYYELMYRYVEMASAEYVDR